MRHDSRHGDLRDRLGILPPQCLCLLGLTSVQSSSESRSGGMFLELSGLRRQWLEDPEDVRPLLREQVLALGRLGQNPGSSHPQRHVEQDALPLCAFFPSFVKELLRGLL